MDLICKKIKIRLKSCFFTDKFSKSNECVLLIKIPMKNAQVIFSQKLSNIQSEKCEEETLNTIISSNRIESFGAYLSKINSIKSLDLNKCPFNSLIPKEFIEI